MNIFKGKIDLFFLSTLILITLLVTIPGLYIPRMLIDDGESLRGAISWKTNIQQGDFGQILLEETNLGLLRPTYWVWHLVNYLLFGFNLVGMRFMHILLQLGTIMLLYLVTKRFTNKSVISFLACILYVLFSPIGENMYRLGTGEPILVFLLLYYLILLHVSAARFIHYLVAFIVVLGLYFAKPTVVVLIPITVLYVLIFQSGKLFQKPNSFKSFTRRFSKEKWYIYLLILNFFSLSVYLILRKIINI